MQYSELDLVRMTPRNRGDVLTQLQRQIDKFVECDWLTDDEAEHCLYIERLIQLLWALPTQICLRKYLTHRLSVITMGGRTNMS